MLLPAQCEKAVTIPEPLWRPTDGPSIPDGSKTPLVFCIFALGEPLRPVSGASDSWVLDVFLPVFRGLQAKRASGRERFRSAAGYLQYGHLPATQRARFGPNFVTIQPTGVCLCST
jgi:hypothetical protein